MILFAGQKVNGLVVMPLALRRGTHKFVGLVPISYEEAIRLAIDRAIYSRHRK